MLMQKCVINFNVTLDLIDYFQVLDEMPWLSESDIKDIPPVMFPIHCPSLPHSLCLPARHEVTFTIWLSITKLQKCANISLMSSPLMDQLWTQDTQWFNMSKEQNTLQQLFPQSSPWFCIPDSLSLVCTPGLKRKSLAYWQKESAQHGNYQGQAWLSRFPCRYSKLEEALSP